MTLFFSVSLSRSGARMRPSAGIRPTANQRSPARSLQSILLVREVVSGGVPGVLSLRPTLDVFDYLIPFLFFGALALTKAVIQSSPGCGNYGHHRTTAKQRHSSTSTLSTVQHSGMASSYRPCSTGLSWYSMTSMWLLPRLQVVSWHFIQI